MSKSKRLNKDKQSKNSKMKKIYTPRPGMEDDVNEVEVVKDESKSWLKHFTETEMLDRYEPIRELGRGSYGLVYEGKVLEKGVIQCPKLKFNQRIAIKKVRRVFHTETDAKRLLRELRILRIVRNHDSIVKLFDIVPPSDPKHFETLTLIFEFADADLGKIFRTNQFFTRLHVQYMLYQILLGLKYIHSAQIVHRDLKPANILINEDCSIKVCDFGLARGFEEEIGKTTNFPEQKNGQNGNAAAGGVAEAKEKTKEELKKKKLLKKKKISRSVTRHVVTRWYRGPEVILLQQKPKTLAAVDMWSVGAIFAELLQMMKENRPDPSRRSPIFPGESCFPLSIKDQMEYLSRVDQMQVILDIIGTPTDQEIAKIDDDKAQKYMHNLPFKKARNLRRMFPGCVEDLNIPNSNDNKEKDHLASERKCSALDLLRNLLRFDVDKRFTVDHALNHPYLISVRDKSCERSKKPVSFAFENAQLGAKKLREYILEETLKYNKTFQESFLKSGAMPNTKKAFKKQQQASLIANQQLYNQQNNNGNYNQNQNNYQEQKQ